jgi:hypothetical protein
MRIIVETGKISSKQATLPYLQALCTAELPACKQQSQQTKPFAEKYISPKLLVLKFLHCQEGLGCN